MCAPLHSGARKNGVSYFWLNQKILNYYIENNFLGIFQALVQFWEFSELSQLHYWKQIWMRQFRVCGSKSSWFDSIFVLNLHPGRLYSGLIRRAIFFKASRNRALCGIMCGISGHQRNQALSLKIITFTVYLRIKRFFYRAHSANRISSHQFKTV